mgnify:CR=1 FL=1
MKSQPVEFLDFVEHDLRYARAFYDSWQTDGGRKFLGKFYETADWIEWNPEQFPRQYRRFRRAIIRRTYFGIFFAVEPGVTTVVAVLDLRQDPRVIRSLLGLRKPLR